MFIEVYVQPGAKSAGFCGYYDGKIKIRLRSAATEGKANQELIRFIADALSIPVKSVSIKHGATSRVKLVEINENIEKDELVCKISSNNLS